MAVLRDFRRIADALERLAAQHGAFVRALEENKASTDRLDDLELSRSRFEADIEGLFLKAEGKLKAAANAEARERTMARKRFEESDTDPFDDDREEEQEALPEGYAEAGYPEEMHAVPVGVETNSKAHALRFKFS